MRCYDPAEQVFDLGDMIIGIDWGKNGDKAVQTTLRRNTDGTFTLIEFKEMEKCQR